MSVARRYARQWRRWRSLTSTRGSSKKALQAVKEKVKTLCRQDTNLPPAVVLHHLNPVLRGWTAYFRHGVSSATFPYLPAFHLAPGLRVDAAQAPPVRAAD